MYSLTEIEEHIVKVGEKDGVDEAIRLRLVESTTRLLALATELVDNIRNHGWKLDRRGHALFDRPCPEADEALVCELLGHGTNVPTAEELAQDVCVSDYSCDHRCQTCGEGHFHLRINRPAKTLDVIRTAYRRNPGSKWGSDRIVIDEDCLYKDGFPEYSVEINVPSGKMILANHLHPVYCWYKEEPYNEDMHFQQEYSINQLAGRKRVTEAMASIGCVELNVGNCACEMFSVDGRNDEFVVGAWLSETGKEYGVKDSSHDPRRYKQVGDVCTDFWGFYICDHADFLKRVGDDDLGPETERDGMIWQESKTMDRELGIIPCEPGRYRFTHRYHLLEDDKAQIYTRITRVGECTCPVCGGKWEDHDFGVPAPVCPGPALPGKSWKG